MSFIEERLSELDEEKEELQAYDQLDKNRRALEYNLFDKELVRATSQLEAAEESRAASREEQQTLFSRLRTAQDRVADRDDLLSAAKQTLERQVSRRKTKAEELAESVRDQSRLQVQLVEATSFRKSIAEERQSLQSRLSEGQRLMRLRERELAELEPQYRQATDETSCVQQQLVELRGRMEGLYGKQGRNKQFNSLDERNTFIQSQISAISAQVEGNRDLGQKMERDIRQEQANIHSEQQLIAQLEAEGVRQSKALEDCSAHLQELLKRRNEAQEFKKNLWRQQETLTDQMNEATGELEKGKAMYVI